MIKGGDGEAWTEKSRMTRVRLLVAMIKQALAKGEEAMLNIRNLKHYCRCNGMGLPK